MAATASADSSAKLWDAVNGDCIFTFPHKRVVRTVDFSPVSAPFRAWDLCRLLCFEVIAGSLRVCAPKFCALDAQDSRTLATGGYESIVRLYDLQRPEAEPRVLSIPGFKARIRKLLWTPDGRGLYMGSDDGVLRRWDVATGTIVQEVAGLAAKDPEKNGVQDMELSRDSNTMILAVGEHVTFVDPHRLEITKSFHMDRDIETASLHPVHQKTFLAGGSNVWVHLHDSETGAELATQRGHHGKVHCVRFAPNGATYTSGADDATIRVWRYDEPSSTGSAQQRQSLSSSSSSSQPSGSPIVSNVSNGSSSSSGSSIPRMVAVSGR